MYLADTPLSSTGQEACKWCGNIHLSKCPLVKEISYFPNGTVKKVKFLTAQDYANPSYPMPYPVYNPPNPVWWQNPITFIGLGTHVPVPTGAGQQLVDWNTPRTCARYSTTNTTDILQIAYSNG